MVYLAREERNIILLYAFTDLLIYWVALSLATVSRWDAFHLLDFPELWRDRALCMAIFGAAALGVGCYHADRMLDRFDAVYYALIALAVSALTQFAIVALAPVDQRMISRRELVIGSVLAAVMLPLWRLAAVGLM